MDRRKRETGVPVIEQPVPAGLYDTAYYLEHMDGADAFRRSHGRELPLRLEYALRLACIRPGQRVLDAGCGRGEAALQCALAGGRAYGLDFSHAALQTASGLQGPDGADGARMHFTASELQRMPFAASSFDAVLMLDVVEHLYPNQLLAALGEARRVLRPGGRLVIHTMPNADYYRWGYPVYRWLNRLVGRRLPKDARTRWYRGESHVNIQSPRSLLETLEQAQFDQIRVWLQPLNDQRSLRFSLSIYPIRWILCNDILGVAVKP